MRDVYGLINTVKNLIFCKHYLNSGNKNEEMKELIKFLQNNPIKTIGDYDEFFKFYVNREKKKHEEKKEDP